MSEINNKSSGGSHAHSGGKKVRAKKASPRRNIRLDMTPMVDLAFLLLTFFILATSMQKPAVMPLVMPEKPDTTSVIPPIKPENLLNLVLTGNNHLYWYFGEDVTKAQRTDYSVGGLRKMLLANRANRKLWVFVKPSDASVYQNVVDVLDELNITHIPRYSLAELTDAEHTLFHPKSR